MAEYKSLHPVKFYREYLENNIRPDGRGFDKFRPIVVNLGSISTADGSAIAKIGRTTVICGIKAELCKPKSEKPGEGFLVPNLELPPLCSPAFKPGPPSDQAQVLSHLISDIIINSKCIDLTELCIHHDKLAWCLFVDLICLDFDGSVVDACILALISALKSTTLPSVDYDPALDNKLVNLEERKALNVKCIPVSTTFVIFDNKYILMDPNVEEENLCTGVLVIVVKDDELCYAYKPGGSYFTDDQLFDCIAKSKTRSPDIKKLINNALSNT